MKGLGLVMIFAAGALGSACVLDGSSDPVVTQPGVAPAAPPDTTRGYLGTPRSFRVKSGGRANVTARRMLGPDIEETADLPILDGELTLHARADGRLVVDALNLSLGDIHLSPASVPPDGLDLMAVTLRLENETPRDVRWTDDDSTADANGTVRLLLDWSLRGLEGEVVPLATQNIDGVPLDLEVIPDRGGGLTAVVRAERDGVFWDWTGLLELADLRIEVEAARR